MTIYSNNHKLAQLAKLNLVLAADPFQKYFDWTNEVVMRHILYIDTQIQTIVALNASWRRTPLLSIQLLPRTLRLH